MAAMCAMSLMDTLHGFMIPIKARQIKIEKRNAFSREELAFRFSPGKDLGQDGYSTEISLMGTFL